MRILLIRHGDPDYEKDSLTEKGFREADLLAARLKNERIDAAYLHDGGEPVSFSARFCEMYTNEDERHD